MSDKNENLVLRPAAPEYGPLAWTTTASAAVAIAKAYGNQDQVSLVCHGEKHDGYHIETNQAWYSVHGHKTLGLSTAPATTATMSAGTRSSSSSEICCSPRGRSTSQLKKRKSALDSSTFRSGRTELGLKGRARRSFESTTKNTWTPASLEDQSLPVLKGEARQRFIDRWYVRYQFFLVADTEAIASVVDSPETPPPYLTEATPWTNVVQVAWPEVEDDDDEPDDGYEIVDGTDLFNVGVHRHSVQTLYPGLWTGIQYFDVQYWYERPPGVKWESA